MATPARLTRTVGIAEPVGVELTTVPARTMIWALVAHGRDVPCHVAKLSRVTGSFAHKG